MRECPVPECENKIEDEARICEDCEPTEEEIEEMKRWAEQYSQRWRESTEKLKEAIQDCSDCDTPEDGANTLCERHEAQSDLAFSGEDTAERDRELASLEMRQNEDLSSTPGDSDE